MVIERVAETIKPDPTSINEGVIVNLAHLLLHERSADLRSDAAIVVSKKLTGELKQLVTGKPFDPESTTLPKVMHETAQTLDRFGKLDLDGRRAFITAHPEIASVFEPLVGTNKEELGIWLRISQIDLAYHHN
ncbi:MAG: hypothetical protein Q8P92_01000 [Candidatus Daviesbacteria bacterium]|nr:hypothetical protein [Candidatus Daviesbacteria bacterium]